MRSNDRRAELLDRAYRRGYALRWRRRVQTTFAGLIVIAVVAAGAVSLTRGHGDHKVTVVQPSTTTLPATCVTAIDAVPAAQVPRDVAAWAGGAPVIGEGALWTIVSAVHVGPTHNGPTWDLKFPWYTKPNGLPVINARRLDGPGTFHSSVDRAVDSRGAWVASSLAFSNPGCWEVTARFRSSTLRFRVPISSPPSTVEFADQTNGVGLTFNCKVPPAADPVCNFDILSSSDAGQSWTRVGGVQAIAYPGWRGYPDIELAASGPNVWVYGTRTFVSHDGGRTFAEVHLAGLVSALVPEGDTVWVASRACALCPTRTLQSSSIGGGPWTTIAGFPNLGDPYVDLVRPSATVAYVVGSDTHSILFRTGDGGRTWQARKLPPPASSWDRTATVTLAALGSDQVWMLNGASAPGRNQQKALYRSDDGGQRWTLVADTNPARPGVGHLPARGLGLGLTVVTPQRIWIALDRGPFVGTLDGGRQWLDTGITTHVEQILFVDPLHGWAWNGGGYRTTDGTHWTLVAG